MTESTWAEVGEITVKPTDSVVEVGPFELSGGADTIWVRMTNTGEESGWPWSYGILSFKTEEGQPLGSIKAYNSYDGEVFRLGVGLAPSVRSGKLTFEPRGFNLAWVSKGNSWPLKFEAQSGGASVSSSFWNRDPENGIITPKTSGDNLDMRPGWIKAKELVLTDGTGADNDRDVPGYQEGFWTPTVTSGTCGPAIGPHYWWRIGNAVTIKSNLKNFSDTETTNPVEIRGLPYSTSTTKNGAYGTARMGKVSYASGGAPMCYAGGDRVGFSIAVAGANSQTLRHDDFMDDESAIAFQLDYLTTDTSWKPINNAVVGRRFSFDRHQI